MFYKKIEQFESKYREILNQLKLEIEDNEQPYQALVISLKDRIDDAVELMQVFLKLTDPLYRNKTDDYLKLLIGLFQKYLVYLKNIEDEQLHKSVIVELITEKINNIIQTCECALPAIKNASPKKIALPLTSLKSDRKPVKPSISKKKKKTSEKHLPSQGESEDYHSKLSASDKIEELIKHAMQHPANKDDELSLDLIEMYSSLFEDEVISMQTLKACRKKTELLISQDLASKQSNVNLCHFVLVNFSSQLNNRYNLKHAFTISLLNSLIKLMNESIVNYEKNNGGSYIKLRGIIKDSFELYKHYLSRQDLIKKIEREELSSHVDINKIETILSEDAVFDQLVKIDESFFNGITTSNEKSTEKWDLTKYRELNETNVQQVFEHFSSQAKTNKHFANKFHALLNGWVSAVKKQETSVTKLARLEKLEEIRRLSKDFFENLAKTRIPQPLAEGESAPSLDLALKVQDLSSNLDRLRLTTSVDPTAMVTRKKLELTSRIFTPMPSNPQQNNRESFAQFVKTYLSQPLFEPLQAVLLRLREHGIRFVLTGGFLRDLLVQAPFNDLDFIIYCHPDTLCKILSDLYFPNKEKMPHLLRASILIQKGIKHDFVCGFENEADFEINALRFDGNSIQDPYHVLEQARGGEFLTMIGDCSQRYINEPWLIYRSIRLMNSTSKPLEPQVMAALRRNCSGSIPLEINFYLHHIGALFLRNFQVSVQNVQTINEHQLYGCLVPKPLYDKAHFIQYMQNDFLSHLEKLYQERFINCENDSFKKAQFELLALFLLPEVSYLYMHIQNVDDSVNQVVELFCAEFTGLQSHPNMTELQNAELIKDRERTKRNLTSFLRDKISGSMRPSMYTPQYHLSRTSAYSSDNLMAAVVPQTQPRHNM